RTQHAAHLSVGEVRGGVAEVVHHGGAEIQGVVFLGVVADLQAVPGQYLSCVRLIDTGEQAQQRRLSCTVESDHHDPRAAIDREVDPGEHFQGTVALREPLRL